MIPPFERLLQRVRDEYRTDAKGRLVAKAPGSGGRLPGPPAVDQVLRSRLAFPDASTADLALMLSAHPSTVLRRLAIGRGEDEVMVQWLQGYGLTPEAAKAHVEQGRRAMLRSLDVDGDVALGGAICRRSCSWCDGDAMCIELDAGVGFMCAACLRRYLRRVESAALAVAPTSTPSTTHENRRRPARARVIDARAVRGENGGRRWRVQLTCGHEVERRDQFRRPPREVLCDKCRREAFLARKRGAR